MRNCHIQERDTPAGHTRIPKEASTHQEGTYKKQRTGIPDERFPVLGSVPFGKPVLFAGLYAQIRTMLDEQRRTIIAEYSEKVLHHELLAAQAEQDRKILQEELLRQQQDFREVHQQDLMKQKELQKFQNSTFDEFAQKKFIEDQKIMVELSGRLQELQNEVNCMNDSKDFRDAESIRSGNSHVARGMGSSRLACNRRRRTREGPEPACVQTPFHYRVAHAGGEG